MSPRTFISFVPIFVTTAWVQAHDIAGKFTMWALEPVIAWTFPRITDRLNVDFKSMLTGHYAVRDATRKVDSVAAGMTGLVSLIIIVAAFAAIVMISIEPHLIATANYAVAGIGLTVAIGLLAGLLAWAALGSFEGLATLVNRELVTVAERFTSSRYRHFAVFETSS